MSDLSNKLEDSEADNANMHARILDLEMKMTSLLTEGGQEQGLSSAL